MSDFLFPSSLTILFLSWSLYSTFIFHLSLLPFSLTLKDFPFTVHSTLSQAHRHRNSRHLCGLSVREATQGTMENGFLYGLMQVVKW